MRKYGVVILEGIAIVVGLIIYSVLVVVPEYKEKYGSSDSFINREQYQNMIEVRINETTDFGMVINAKGEIFHLFFFDNSSVFLYNKNIENHNMKDSVSTIMVTLISKGLLTNGSKVEIFYNNESFIKDFQKELNENITRYQLDIIVEEKEKSLQEKAMEIGVSSEKDVLLEFDFYSKEIAKNNARINREGES